MAAEDLLLLLAIAVTLTCPTSAVNVGAHTVRYRGQLYTKTEKLHGDILAEEGVSSSGACAYRCHTKSTKCTAVAYNKVSRRCQLIAVNQCAKTKFKSSSEQKLYIEKTSCPQNWIQIGSSCYYHIRETHNWLTAKLSCEAMGGTLAAITCAEENSAILSWLITEGISGQYVWIGGSDIAVEGTWQWVTGEAFVFEDMSRVGQPVGGTVQNCLTINFYDYAWRDTTCDSVYSDTVCETQLFIN